MKIMEGKILKLLHGMAIVAICLALSDIANAQVDTRDTAMDGRSMRVPLYKSQLVRLRGPATRVSVGNPDVADILILRASQLYVLGKDLGTTNVLLWDSNDVLIDTIEVEVTHDLQSLKRKLYDLLPSEQIEVHSAQRNIILSGNVSNVGNMEAALKIARGYFAQFSAVDTTEFEFSDKSPFTQDIRHGVIRTEFGIKFVWRRLALTASWNSVSTEMISQPWELSYHSWLTFYAIVR
jgi:Flp pilus assembly secretin CpaC